MTTFATYCLLFGQEKWLQPHLENVCPHFDKVYIAYSQKPWVAFNPKARTQIPTNPASIPSNLPNNVEVITGEWASEVDQRNAAVNKAKQDGIDYLFDIDLDEFYFHADLEEIKKTIASLGVTRARFFVPGITFWKSFHYAVEAPDREFPICADIPIGFDLQPDTKHIRKRKVKNYDNYVLTPYCCYHASYVLSNDELRTKIQIWGHAHQVVPGWFEEKWLNWQPDTINLHPVYPTAWVRALPFTGKLPETIARI